MLDLTESGGRYHDTNPFFFLKFLYSLDSWSENRFHICLIQDISEMGVRLGSLSVWEGGREGERNGGRGARGYWVLEPL